MESMNNSLPSNRLPRLICLIGMDGTGKTTQCQAFVEAMRSLGIGFRHVPCRWDSALLRFLMRVMTKLFSCQGKNLANYDERTELKKGLFRNRFIAMFYQSFVLIDYLIQIWIKVSIPLMRGKNIICDRYIYDSVIDLAVDFVYSHDKIDHLIERLFRLIPTPSLVFVLDLSDELASQRNIPKGEGLSLDYFSERRKLYQYLSQKDPVVLCDAAVSIEKLGNFITAKVLETVTGEHSQ